LILRAKIEFVYWCKSQVLQIILILEAWAWKWWEAYSTVLYEKNYS